MKASQPIQITDDPGPGHGKQIKMEHPAFGQITVSRVQGGATLYGTDFNHQHFIVVTIHESVAHRSLSNDWNFADKTICEIWMSEAQWATFVSSFNQGSGTPCTLAFRERDGRVPMIENNPDISKVFKAEFMETLQGTRDNLDELDALIDSLPGLSVKSREKMRWKVEHARRGVGGSLKFVKNQMDEHVENTFEKAKVEIHGYIQQHINQAGLRALSGDSSGAIELEQ